VAGGRAAGRALAGALVFALVVAAGAAAVVGLLRASDRDRPLAVRCAALSGDTTWYLAPDQADTAALLTATTLHRGMPARAATIAIATGLQESKLRNIDYGDRDSVGIFQQRPSQGWGTVEQIMDPVYSTTAFLDALDRVDGYEDMEITVAAQTVQRSGFPDAYAQHEARSRAWASSLTGWSPATLTCSLPAPDGPGDPAAVVERVTRDFAGTVAAEPADHTVTLRAAGLATAEGDGSRVGWAVAQWAVAVAEPLALTSVQHGDQVWERGAGGWEPAETPIGVGEVLVTTATD
jgi:hypothetical protein